MRTRKEFVFEGEEENKKEENNNDFEENFNNFRKNDKSEGEKFLLIDSRYHKIFKKIKKICVQFQKTKYR